MKDQYPIRLVLILAALALAACQPAAGQAGQLLSPADFLPLEAAQARVFHPVEAPVARPGWTNYTDGNDVTAIAFDKSGAVWTAGRGGVVRWDAAQDAYTKYTAEHGLPGNDIRALAVAPDGSLWAGSSRGELAHFNGATWETLDHPVGDTVSALAAGPQGDLWVGSNQGIAHFDGQAWRDYTLRDGLAGSFVHSLSVTAGGVWAGFSGGASFFDGQRWTNYHFPLGKTVSAIASGPDGSAWFAAGSTLSRYQNGKWVEYAIQISPEEEINAISTGAQGEVWLTSATRIMRWDGAGLEAFYLKDNGVMVTSALDASGRLWVGRDHGGLARLVGQRLDAFQTPDGMGSNMILSLGVDSNGAFWAGTNQGAACFDGQGWKHYTIEDGLPDNEVVSIQIPAGDIAAGIPAAACSAWFGTPRGIASFNGQTWSTYSAEKGSGLLSDKVNLLASGPDGSVWAGAASGVARFTGQLWTTYYAGLHSNDIRALAIASNRSVFAASRGEIAHFNGQAWLPIPAPGLSNISSLAISPQGGLWVGTLNGGLILLFDASEKHDWSTTSQQAWTTEQGLPGNTVHAISVGLDGSIWAATEAGAARLANGQVSAYTTRDGLGDNEVWAIFAAPDGSVWMGSPYGGISKLYP